MEIIDQFYDGKFPIKNILLILLLLLFFSGIGLLISGIKIASENKAMKTVSIVFGILLILAAILTGILAIINSLAYFD